MRDDVIAELGALDLGGTFHLAGEVVGDFLAADGAVEALEQQVGLANGVGLGVEFLTILISS